MIPGDRSVTIVIGDFICFREQQFCLLFPSTNPGSMFAGVSSDLFSRFSAMRVLAEELKACSGCRV